MNSPSWHRSDIIKLAMVEAHRALTSEKLKARSSAGARRTDRRKPAGGDRRASALLKSALEGVIRMRVPLKVTSTSGGTGMRANSPYVVGLTGGVSTGKSTILATLKELGAVVMSADEASHRLTAPGGEALPAIRETFGDAVFLPDGTLDRRALGDIVFHDPSCRRALEAIIHPAVQRSMLSEIEKAADDGERVVVMEVPLLFETGMDALCGEVWVATLDAESQTCG
jgi:dephospho-CoA kinase